MTSTAHHFIRHQIEAVGNSITGQTKKENAVTSLYVWETSEIYGRRGLKDKAIFGQNLVRNLPCSLGNILIRWRV